jgi:Protein of unknown function (DUF3108)
MFGAWLLVALTQPLHGCEEPASVLVPMAPAPVAAVPVVAPKPVAPVPSALAQPERARYRIDYGVLEVGELEVAIAAAVPGAAVVHADGHGAGGVLGLGHMENRIETDFDLARLDSRRWDNARSGSAGDLRDRGQQLGAGQVRLVRQRGGPAGVPETANVTLAGPLLDPLGFLLRLRVQPPGARPQDPPQVLYVLDGQALWRVTIANAGRVAPPENVAPVPMIRLEAEAEPVRWDGAPDLAERHRRSFKLWLSDDEAHVPLRLEMPVGLADVVVALTDIERRPAVAKP